ncbi:MAG: hypothetical protein P8130_15355 [Deltaproteobacteria bacterium]
MSGEILSRMGLGATEDQEVTDPEPLGRPAGDSGGVGGHNPALD